MRVRCPPRRVSQTQLQCGIIPASCNIRTALMSPCGSAAAKPEQLVVGSGRPSFELSRSRRRALVHARQIRANPSGACAEPLNAASPRSLQHTGQVFLVIRDMYAPPPRRSCRLAPQTSLKPVGSLFLWARSYHNESTVHTKYC